jgi:hypothetical protein
MALNSSGPLSMGGSTVGQSINLELGVSATAQGALNDASFRTLAGVASGQISISNFYGKSNTVGNYSLTTLTSNIQHYGNSTRVDSSGNQWLFCQSGTSPQPILVAKWNSANVIQSVTNSSTFGGTPYFSGAVITPNRSQVIGSDSSGNMYVIGNCFGSGPSLPGMIGTTYTKYNSSGTYQAGTLYSRYATSFNGYPAYLSYFYGKTIGSDSSGNGYSPVYWYYVWIQGYSGPCCCTPNYYADTDVYSIKTTSTPGFGYSYRWGRMAGQTGGYAVTSSAVDSSGNSVSSTNAQVPGVGYKTLILKQNSSGTVQWAYSYRITVSGSNATFSSDEGRQLLDSTGSFYSLGVTGAGYMKVNSSGTYQYATRFVPVGFSSYDLRGGVIDSSDNLYLYGQANNGSSNLQQLYVIKFNSSGTLQWARSISYDTSPFNGGGTRKLDEVSVAINGTSLSIAFNASNPATPSSAVWGSLLYPQSGSFTGTTNVFFPGSSTNYLTFTIASLSVTFTAATLVTASAESISMTSDNPGASSITYSGAAANTPVTTNKDF